MYLALVSLGLFQNNKNMQNRLPSTGPEPPLESLTLEHHTTPPGTERNTTLPGTKHHTITRNETQQPPPGTKHNTPRGMKHNTTPWTHDLNRNTHTHTRLKHNQTCNTHFFCDEWETSKVLKKNGLPQNLDAAFGLLATMSNRPPRSPTCLWPTCASKKAARSLSRTNTFESTRAPASLHTCAAAHSSRIPQVR